VEIALVGALLLFACTEVVVQYQKFQLRKKMNQELDEYEKKKNSENGEEGV